MMLVLDASVAAKLVLRESDSERAAKEVEGASKLLAPDYLFLEVASALLKAFRKDEFPGDDIEAAMDTVERVVDETWPASELLREAIPISRSLRHPIYDCLYLALGQRHRVPVLTADAKLVQACERAPAWLGAAKLLGTDAS